LGISVKFTIADLRFNRNPESLVQMGDMKHIFGLLRKEIHKVQPAAGFDFAIYPSKKAGSISPHEEFPV